MIAKRIKALAMGILMTCAAVFSSICMTQEASAADREIAAMSAPAYLSNVRPQSSTVVTLDEKYNNLTGRELLRQSIYYDMQAQMDAIIYFMSETAAVFSEENGFKYDITTEYTAFDYGSNYGKRKRLSFGSIPYDGIHSDDSKYTTAEVDISNLMDVSNLILFPHWGEMFNVLGLLDCSKPDVSSVDDLRKRIAYCTRSNESELSMYLKKGQSHYYLNFNVGNMMYSLQYDITTGTDAIEGTNLSKMLLEMRKNVLCELLQACAPYSYIVYEQKSELDELGTVSTASLNALTMQDVEARYLVHPLIGIIPIEYCISYSNYAGGLGAEKSDTATGIRKILNAYAKEKNANYAVYKGGDKVNASDANKSSWFTTSDYGLASYYLALNDTNKAAFETYFTEDEPWVLLGGNVSSSDPSSKSLGYGTSIQLVMQKDSVNYYCLGLYMPWSYVTWLGNFYWFGANSGKLVVNSEKLETFSDGVAQPNTQIVSKETVVLNTILPVTYVQEWKRTQVSGIYEMTALEASETQTLLSQYSFIKNKNGLTTSTKAYETKDLSTYVNGVQGNITRRINASGGSTVNANKQGEVLINDYAGEIDWDNTDFFTVNSEDELEEPDLDDPLNRRASTIIDANLKREDADIYLDTLTGYYYAPALTYYKEAQDVNTQGFLRRSFLPGYYYGEYHYIIAPYEWSNLLFYNLSPVGTVPYILQSYCIPYMKVSDSQQVRAADMYTLETSLSCLNTTANYSNFKIDGDTQVTKQVNKIKGTVIIPKVYAEYLCMEYKIELTNVETPGQGQGGGHYSGTVYSIDLKQYVPTGRNVTMQIDNVASVDMLSANSVFTYDSVAATDAIGVYFSSSGKVRLEGSSNLQMQVRFVDGSPVLLLHNDYYAQSGLLRWLQTENAGNILAASVDKTGYTASTLYSALISKDISFGVDVNTDTLSRYAQIEEELKLARDGSILDMILNVISFVGILFVVYGVFLVLAYILDISNSFTELSLLKLITFGGCEPVWNKEDLNRMGVAQGKTRYVTLKDVILRWAICMLVGITLFSASKVYVGIMTVYYTVLEWLGF